MNTQLSCNVFSIASEVREPRPNFYVTMTAMIAEKTHCAELLDGRIAADAIKRGVAGEVAALKGERGVTPRLAAVILGDDPASAVYVRNKIRACAEVGIGSQHLPMPGTTTTGELLEVVRRLNKDDDVDGILVQLPLPKQIAEIEIIEAVDAAKDVDAFHPMNVGLLALGRPRFVPCTPAGIIELLDRNQIPIE